MSGVVYFVSDGNAIKIGTTKQLSARLSQMQGGNPTKLVVLATVEGSFAHERAVHQELAEHRIKGEWFADCQQVRAAVERYTRDGITPLPSSRAGTSKADDICGDELLGKLFGMSPRDIEFKEKQIEYLRSQRVILEDMVSDLKARAGRGEDVTALIIDCRRRFDDLTAGLNALPKRGPSPITDVIKIMEGGR